jgi:hypothetical protein
MQVSGERVERTKKRGRRGPSRRKRTRFEEEEHCEERRLLEGQI